jgi:uncharacterized protein (DUF2147 family)
MRFSYKIRSGFVQALLALWLCPSAVMWAEEPTPVGLWKTIDDRTHKPRGIVRIFEKNGEYFGRIESSFNEAERKEICDKCSDDRRGKPVIGLEFLRGMIKHGAEYSGGEILDPETGSVYKCRFTLSSDGEMLQVRGYFLARLLGRTQIWLRERYNGL